ncbi:MAG TPA: hypothetical protein VKI19_10480 [Acidimicrobiales bacterium]|nr:hypothetical protein [Acidimicrobiales bacterium]
MTGEVPEPSPGDDPDAQLAAYAAALAAGIDGALAGWVVRSVVRVHAAWSGSVPPAVRSAAEEAGDAARRTVGPAVRDLLGADPDDQRTTPLALVRSAVRYPTEVLAAAGVPPVERDPFAARAFPDDVYDLSPASWADIDDELAETGLAWGAAKAFVHKRRHQGPAPA